MSSMSDKELIFRALNQWANYIETGSVSLSKKDALNSGQKPLIKNLESGQIHFVERLRNLANQELTNNSNFSSEDTLKRVYSKLKEAKRDEQRGMTHAASLTVREVISEIEELLNL